MSLQKEVMAFYITKIILMNCGITTIFVTAIKVELKPKSKTFNLVLFVLLLEFPLNLEFIGYLFVA